MIEKTYKYLAKKKLFRFIMSIISFIYRILTIKNIDSNFLINLEGINEMNIESFSKNRKEGISGILRTRDGGKFLEEVVNSFIEYIDELIIVNNLSTDNTKNICQKLINRYGRKIKYYEYDYEIIREKKLKTNNINSFAYYSNWSISKSSYKIIFKVDDDNLFISNLIKKQIENVRKYSKYINNIYFYYWGLNFYKKNNNIGIVSMNPYSGIYGDIGFFSISNKTYFIQEGVSEKLITNYYHYNLGFSYLHLKYFKEENGLKYAPIFLKKYFLEVLKNSYLENISIYTKNITHSKCINILKKIISNNL